jgi:hypothetical protein
MNMMTTIKIVLVNSNSVRHFMLARLHHASDTEDGFSLQGTTAGRQNGRNFHAPNQVVGGLAGVRTIVAKEVLTLVNFTQFFSRRTMTQ